LQNLQGEGQMENEKWKMENGKFKLSIFNTPEELCHAAAELFVQLSKGAVAAGGPFSVALSGGSTPRRVYQLLASNEYRDRIDWSSTHVFFGDERCVSANDPASNFRMAYETMISKLPIPTENVHPINGEGEVDANARAYEQNLRTFFQSLDWPRFDLIFLGLGDDGHTASLFPGTAALKEQSAWVVPNWVEKLRSFRITLTAPAINHAVEIVFLVTGKEKARALDAVLIGPKDPNRYPAQLIQPVDGSLDWLVDKAAAARLRLHEKM
jgi:6-phosphogluconolactonase